MEKEVKINIKRISFFKIIWFTKLNLEIHKEDPMFKSEQKTRWSRFKFAFNFGLKLLTQHKYALLADRKIAGALSIEKRNESVFVYAVGVVPEFRRRGFATKLMNFTEDFAHRKSKSYICFSVLLANNPAIKLYEKLGYQSLGVGLTLVRFLVWKIEEELNLHFGNEITFHEIMNRKKALEKINSWWIEEIENFSGIDGKLLATQDNLIDFKIKQNWHFFDIKTFEEISGILIVIPSGFFKTMVLFTNPRQTWDRKWNIKFMSKLYQNKIFTDLELSQLKNQKLSKSTILQIFLTNQHKDLLLENFDSKTALHDSTDDRQIFFKKIEKKLNN